MATSQRGKFRDRMKKIKLYRLKEKLKLSKETSIKVGKVIVGTPLIIGGGIKLAIDSLNQTENIVKENLFEDILRQNSKNNKVFKKDFYKKIDKVKIIVDNKDDLKQDKNINLLNDYKEKVLNIKNKLDIIESEAYILNENNDENELLKGCNDQEQQTDKLLDKIDNVKHKYLTAKEKVTQDIKITTSKEEIENKIENLGINTIENEFLKIEKEISNLELEIIKLEIKKEEKIEKKGLKPLDIWKLSYDLIDVDKVNYNCNKLIIEQQKILDNLNKKINNISSLEKKEYNVEGLGTFLGSLFKYLGTLFVAPFSGLMPGIAISTLATKKVVNNLADNIKIKEKTKTIYAASDYENDIINSIHDLSSMDDLIDSTLEDIYKIKKELKSKLGSNSREYENIISKINKLESNIQNNKYKVHILKTKMEQNKKINKDKLVKVKVLNQKQKK